MEHFSRHDDVPRGVRTFLLEWAQSNCRSITEIPLVGGFGPQTLDTDMFPWTTRTWNGLARANGSTARTACPARRPGT